MGGQLTPSRVGMDRLMTFRTQPSDVIRIVIVWIAIYMMPLHPFSFGLVASTQPATIGDSRIEFVCSLPSSMQCGLIPFIGWVVRSGETDGPLSVCDGHSLRLPYTAKSEVCPLQSEIQGGPVYPKGRRDGPDAKPLIEIEDSDGLYLVFRKIPSLIHTDMVTRFACLGAA